MAAGFSTFIKEMLLTEEDNQVIFMKKIIKSVAGILILLSNILLLPAQEIIEPVIKGITDKSPLSYNIGKEMVFFDNKEKAIAFEDYLKTGSGREFSKRHF